MTTTLEKEFNNNIDEMMDFIGYPFEKIFEIDEDIVLNQNVYGFFIDGYLILIDVIHIDNQKQIVYNVIDKEENIDDEILLCDFIDDYIKYEKESIDGKSSFRKVIDYFKS